MVSWTGVFMRPYYLRLNANGYYVVSFTNKETGTRTKYKSTHTKNYDEVLQLAMTWYTSGAPVHTVAPTPVVEVASVVEEPPPKKKVVVVHKKNALADSGLLPEDVAQKVYEPLNPDCTIKLCEFLRNFWTPEKSEYIQNKRAHKKSIGDYHCKEMRGMVDRYWLPFFGEEFTVGELSEQYLEDFLQELANFRGLNGATINHARTPALVERLD